MSKPLNITADSDRNKKKDKTLEQADNFKKYIIYQPRRRIYIFSSAGKREYIFFMQKRNLQHDTLFTKCGKKHERWSD